jgi:hypothetical protein
MGTFCAFSVRRCAVTVTSAMASELASVSAAAADARLVRLAAAQLLKMAAIAYDNFGFEFMLHPFRYIENRSVSRHFYSYRG